SRVSSMASFDTLCSNILLTVTALYSSYSLAPSLGFFMLGLSAGLSSMASLTTHFSSLPKEDMSWSAEVLALTLLSFEFLWLSEDHNTAFILLCGSCSLVALCDWLSADAFSVMTHCLCLSSLSCCLTVCLFTGNLLGAIGGVALTLPLAMLSTAAENGLMEWILRVFLSVGCWVSPRALSF
uniref:Uncharacterized protein n=1 Tax=Neogobius melanostomus TaxID=47308 RepID=A0A8C6T1W0_9GOBI